MPRQPLQQRRKQDVVTVAVAVCAAARESHRFHARDQRQDVGVAEVVVLVAAGLALQELEIVGDAAAVVEQAAQRERLFEAGQLRQMGTDVVIEFDRARPHLRQNSRSHELLGFGREVVRRPGRKGHVQLQRRQTMMQLKDDFAVLYYHGAETGTVGRQGGL
ncbi:hypothetical protein NHH73_27965 [Oxalobacteraceae bacterium OTU3CINTB1]|nr:hypothetical protein NHH73_27965 [Oxalobacteraceae bacterium OTU3CINTB1]